MKTIALWLCAAMIFCAAPTTFAQKQLPTLKPYTVVIPDRNPNATDALAPAIQLRVWSKTWTATKDKKSRVVKMVGASPFVSTATTKIPTVIIPVVINIAGTLFDPTAADTTCMVAPNDVPLTVFKQSPLFNNAPFTMNGVNIGTTQYVDAFQRANFWTKIQSTYHTLLAPITVAATQTYNTGTSGAVYSTASFGNGGCGPNKDPLGNFGVMDINAFDAWVNGTALPTAGVTKNQFPILLLYDVVMSNGAPLINNCCILGYHGSTSGQTYSPMEFDQTGIFGSSVNDTSVAAHEIGEWQDDPFGNNLTPAWGNIGQVSGCQGNLEVGDPLSGSMFPTVTMSSNHYSYHLQELAFFSWFFNAQTDPSIGAGGKFSDHGTFGGPSKVCPPGGTF